MKWRWANALVLGLVWLGGFSARAEVDLKANLLDQIKILDSLKPTVDGADRAPLFYFKKSISEILLAMDANTEAGRQPVDFPTMRLLQDLNDNYESSKSFYGWDKAPSLLSVFSPATSNDLKRLQQDYLEVQGSLGLNASPYSTKTESTFKKLYALIKSMEALPLDGELQAQLRGLVAPIGNVVAQAALGDTTCVYKSAQRVTLQIRELYPRLTNVSEASAGYEVVMEFIGLNEIYAGYSKLDQTVDIGSCQ